MTQTTGNGPLRDHVPVTPGVTDRTAGTRIDRAWDWATSRPWLAEISVALFATLVYGWRIGRPSPWWDEAITRDVTSRSSAEIMDLAGHVDLVHTTYYLIVHAVLGESSSVTPIRLLSLVAAVLTAVTLVRLGRETGQ